MCFLGQAAVNTYGIFAGELAVHESPSTGFLHHLCPAIDSDYHKDNKDNKDNRDNRDNKDNKDNKDVSRGKWVHSNLWSFLTKKYNKNYWELLSAHLLYPEVLQKASLQ